MNHDKQEGVAEIPQFPQRQTHLTTKEQNNMGKSAINKKSKSLQILEIASQITEHNAELYIKALREHYRYNSEHGGKDMLFSAWLYRLLYNEE